MNNLKDNFGSYDWLCFMGKYMDDHAACPKCGETSCSVTYVDYIVNLEKIDSYRDENRCICSNCGDKHIKHDRVPRKPVDYEKLYMELIMAVVRRFPNESRHETALRYIREREQKATESGAVMELEKQIQKLKKEKFERSWETNPDGMGH